MAEKGEVTAPCDVQDSFIIQIRKAKPRVEVIWPMGRAQRRIQTNLLAPNQCLLASSLLIPLDVKQRRV